MLTAHLKVAALCIHALAPSEPGDVGVPRCLLEGLLRWIGTKADQPGAAAITKHKVQLRQAVAHDLACQVAISRGLQGLSMDKPQHGRV